MKRFVALAAALACYGTAAFAQQSAGVWHPAPQTPVCAGDHRIVPQRWSAFYTDEAALEAVAQSATADADHPVYIDLPAPDGTVQTFRAWRNTTMSAGLQDKYPGIVTLTAESVDNHLVTAKLDYTDYGFHAMVFGPDGQWFVDPFTNQKTGYYQSYNKADYQRAVGMRMSCGFQNSTVTDELAQQPDEVLTGNGLPKLALRTNGTQRRQYTLALACTYEYASEVTGSATPTKAAVLSYMTTSMNRVNGVYERELAVTMTLHPNTDTLIYITSSDPYTNSNGPTMLGQNQTNVNNRIGSANYDIGHVFSTGGGGIASLGSVCSNQKAQGVTGSPSPVGDAFDIDYVAHEMGHQFGGNHTFNSPLGSCGGNNNNSTAYEIGSGTTIMAYAGICGSDDIQSHSDAYFHAASLEEINSAFNSGTGSCATNTTNTNTLATLPAFAAAYSIPYRTPFELTAPQATDGTADTITYCWEQWNRGNFETEWDEGLSAGPIFRSFLPKTDRTRVFPQISKVISNTYSYKGEIRPSVARTLKFKMTERDVYQGWGCWNFPDDVVSLSVVTTDTFLVTSQKTAGITYTANSLQTITWDVANTNAAPVNASTVDIYLSTDGGNTYPYTVQTGVPNTGSAVITVPNVLPTSQARFKVKGGNNVFFNINRSNFTITGGTAVANAPAWAGAVQAYPVPATSQLTIANTTSQRMEARILNAVGQQVWTGNAEAATVVNTSGWPRGVYTLHLRNAADGSGVARVIAVQ